MSSNIRFIRDFNMDIRPEKILKYIGYRKKTDQIPGSLVEIVAEEREKLARFLHPGAVYTVLDHAQTNKHPIFEKAVKVALCICTIGRDLEDECAELMDRNEILRALVLDAFGSESVEEVAVQSNRIIVREAERLNLKPSKRFSPGYGKWDIREQEFVFRVLPAHRIGVSLKESFMMIPRKSISFRVNFYEYETKPSKG